METMFQMDYLHFIMRSGLVIVAVFLIGMTWGRTSAEVDAKRALKKAD